MKFLLADVISVCFIIALFILSNGFGKNENQIDDEIDSLILFFERIPGNQIIELRDFEEKSAFPLDKYRVYYFKVDSLYILGTLPFGHAPSTFREYQTISRDSLKNIDFWTLERLKTMKKDSAHHFVLSFDKIFLIDAGYLINDQYFLLPVTYDDRIEED